MNPTRHMRFGRARDERGSAAIEAVLGAVAFTLFLSLAILGGRVALAHQGVQASAADAARAASIARNPTSAATDARAAAAATLANQQLHCATHQVSVDTSGFAVPVGSPASVSATVTCQLVVADLSLPGIPGTIAVQATMTSPLDTYRGR